MIAYVDGTAVLERVRGGEAAKVAGDVWSRAGEVVTSRLARVEARAGLAALRSAGGIDAAAHGHAVKRLDGVLSEARSVGIDESIATEAAELADRHGLEAADAVHLATALAVRAPRVVVTTWSPPLARAAADCGMPVVPRRPVEAVA
jgi:predicted nucleic acid-binding protein